MPVSLDEMMREVSPEERARIERAASALVTDYRERSGKAEDGRTPLAQAMVGTKARTGERCPEAGLWRVEDMPSATMPVAIHSPMPAYRNRAVTWELVQHAAG